MYEGGRGRGFGGKWHVFGLSIYCGQIPLEKPRGPGLTRPEINSSWAGVANPAGSLCVLVGPHGYPVSMSPRFYSFILQMTFPREVGYRKASF